MTTRIKFQIDTSVAIRNRAKTVAADRAMSLTELVLQALTKLGDKKLTGLIEKDLEQRTRPGRPSTPQSTK